ncbi:hypothetical protein B0I35DRAFT_507623 [Stachybotrys elegans]|uniref:Uncharacterized protein n=1 Tax=Stachybotrys elegans TaxID=80388 RepID=A0A8K0WX32_9HYPO|nr:hypothetical protein B0I35DRAFT_507623 [Stachybotrys elegans]
MASPEALEPPKDGNVADPGAHQLAESSDSEDQFTDAQSYPMSPALTSPVPKTRVERVDSEPAHGEIPGTDAYKVREQDAVPDEIAVQSEATPTLAASDPASPASIPKTVVEEAPGESGQHSVEFVEKRSADATPDEVVKSSEGGQEDAGNNVFINVEATSSPDPVSPSPVLERRPSTESLPSPPPPAAQEEEEPADDDFDDFEEGGEDDDFDDFEDGFEEPTPAAPPPPPPPQNVLPYPIPDFDGISSDDAMAAAEPYLSTLFPPEELDFPAFPPLSKESSVFLTTRSASLWSQLVAPPPLAPPDWIRSRTRRLFLVSLGVPVDLDEILPASKQKKLVLPSLNIPSASPRNSTDSRSVSKLRQGEGNTSSTSVDTQGKPSTSKKRKGPPPQPELDLVAARQLCMATDEALDGMTNQELKEHVAKLEALQGTAKEMLEYWQKRTDEKIGDREAFEGVIENLVKHARKVRT